MQSLDFLGGNENVSTIKWLSAEKHNLNNSPFRIADAFSPQSIKFMEFRNQILPDSNAQILLFAWKGRFWERLSSPGDSRKYFRIFGLPQIFLCFAFNISLVFELSWIFDWVALNISRIVLNISFYCLKYFHRIFGWLSPFTFAQTICSPDCRHCCSEKPENAHFQK